MGGHEHFKPTKYFSIDDIPDDMVKKYSKRDPDNLIYKSRRWVDFKKKQILYTQNDGVPNYLRTAKGRFAYYGLWAGMLFSTCANIYVFNKNYNKKN